MAQIFSKKANVLPLLTLVGLSLGGVATIFLVWYYFSPQYTDVGYAPEQPVPFSHRLHAGQLGMDCRYCHNTVEVSQHANVPPTQTCWLTSTWLWQYRQSMPSCPAWRRWLNGTGCSGAYPTSVYCGAT